MMMMFMGTTNAEKDRLVKEMQKSAKVQEWQLNVAFLSLVIAIVTLLVGGGVFAPTERLTSIIIAIVLIVISILSMVLGRFTTSSSDSSEKRSWYERISALERLRLSALGKDDDELKKTVLHLYLTGLRTNYQYALLEGRKELGDYLKAQIAEHTRMIDHEKA
jgi:hypothetical protein